MARHSIGMRILNGILALFLPPLSVVLVTGCDDKGAMQVVINLILWVCFWIPAMVHAWWIIHTWDKRQENRNKPQVVYVESAPPNHHQSQSNTAANPLSQEQPEYALPAYHEAQHTGTSVQAGRPVEGEKV